MWFRGFADMAARRSALEGFYDSRDWRDHADAANSTMLDSDNVLLLHSARPGSGFDLSGLARPEPSAAWPSSLVGAAVLMLDGPADPPLIGAFEAQVLPRLRRHASRIAYLVTDDRSNDFPRLPVRAGEYALVAVGVCASSDAMTGWQAAFGSDRLPSLIESRIRQRELLRLEPAPRSLFR